MARSSVIIPAYNSAASLPASIEAALAQTQPALEILVIDDGSTDDTAAVAARYGNRIRLLRQANAGQGAARNHGLREARGEFVTFLDADDCWEPDFLAVMEPFLTAHPKLVAASCAFAAERGAGVYHGPDNYRALAEHHPNGLILDDFFAFWADKDHIRTGTALIRRSAIDQAGFQNPDLRISQDLEYWALLATLGPWGLMPRVLWRGGSVAAAKKTGWRRKYAARRKRTPSIEAWQARVFPRLSRAQARSFAVVRGRVASNFALSQILGGDPGVARGLVGAYGADFPGGVTPRIMQRGHALGSLGWRAACLALQMRDRMK
ncbi:MAG: glycosyltransferase family A protein [Pseudomonadota bacterium]